MKVVVAGMTPIGREVSVALTDRGHEVTVVDRDGARLRQAEARVDALMLQAYEGTVDTLRRSGADGADLVVYATAQDELNLFAAAAAGRLGAQRTIAMVRNDTHIAGAPGIARNLHGVDYVLCPLVLTADAVHRAAHGRRVVVQSHLAGNQISVEEIPITPDDPVAGLTVDSLKLSDSVRLVALVRGDAWVPAGPRERMQAGDRVILIGKRGAILRAERRFQPGGVRAPRHAFVIGGGRIGLHVSRAFQAEGVSVSLVERDHDRAEMRAADLPKATVLHGDGTDMNLLEQELASASDVLVTCTDEDETNLVVSLLARGMGIPHYVTLAHRADNVEVYEHLGLPAVVNRPLVVARQIARLAQRTFGVDTVELGGGALLALDVDIGRGGAADGVPLSEAGLPSDAMPGFALQGTKVVPVRPSTVLEGGDRLVVVVPAGRRRAVERFASSGARVGSAPK